MSFAHAPLAACCLFCAGCALAHLACLLIAKVRGTSVGRRVSALSFFLSGSVASYTALVFLHQNLRWFLPLFTEQDALHGALFLVWAVSGFFIGIRWNVFLPVCLAFYLLATIGTALILYRAFGKPVSQHTLTLSETTLKIDDVVLPRTASDPQDVRFSVFHISDTILLPLPRSWHARTDAIDPSYLQTTTWSAYYLSHVVSSTPGSPLAELVVSLPHDTMLPALYTLRIKTDGTHFSYDLAKDL